MRNRHGFQMIIIIIIILFGLDAWDSRDSREGRSDLKLNIYITKIIW